MNTDRQPATTYRLAIIHALQTDGQNQFYTIIGSTVSKVGQKTQINKQASMHVTDGFHLVDGVRLREEFFRLSLGLGRQEVDVLGVQSDVLLRSYEVGVEHLQRPLNVVLRLFLLESQ